jgi:hypothetical protein
MRTLLEQRSADAAAAEAVELFVYAAKKHIGALGAALGGLDTLVWPATRLLCSLPATSPCKSRDNEKAR